MGYRFEPDKFALTGFTRLDSQTVSPPRIAECPLQLEVTNSLEYILALL
ncbi:MAG: hypothetical protein ACRCYY_02020 [Trueperaceae bacterium]